MFLRGALNYKDYAMFLFRFSFRSKVFLFLDFHHKSVINVSFMYILRIKRTI